MTAPELSGAENSGRYGGKDRWPGQMAGAFPTVDAEGFQHTFWGGIHTALGSHRNAVEYSRTRKPIGPGYDGWEIHG